MSETAKFVPTGVVPRVRKDNVTVGTFDINAPGFIRPHDPIAQAVDDYLLMERKARAWDELARWAHREGRSTSIDIDYLLDLMGSLVHPAQSSAPADR